MSLDQRAQVLSLISPARYGVREVIQKLRWKSSHVISLLEQMENEGLVELDKYRAREISKKGRPKKVMKCTSLGNEFLETYHTLKMKPLRARKEDLKHAVKDALYAQRLVENGHSPFKLFLELNTFAHNAKISSETPSSI